MGDPLAVLLVTGVHAVRVAVAAPAHGDAEPVQPALELVSVAAPGWACCWWEGMHTRSLPLPQGAGNGVGSGGERRTGHSAWQGNGRERARGTQRCRRGVIWAPAVSCKIACLERGGGLCSGGAFGSPGRTAAELRVHLLLARSLPPSQGRTWGPRGRTLSSSTGAAQLGLTLVGAVGMSLVTVVPAVIVPIAGPVHRDAAPTVALELVAGAGVAAARLVAVVPTVIVWRGKKSGKGLRERPAGQEGGLAEARQEGGRQ